MADWHQGNPDIIVDRDLAAAAYSGAQEVDGWEKDVELSNENRTVYQKEGKAKVAFRGTNPKNLKDLGTDLLVGLGLQDKSSRMKNAVKATDMVIAKYGKENVSLTGHSLGGSQAAYVSRARGLDATGFNAAFSRVDEVRNRTYSKFHAVQTKSDPIGGTVRNVRKVGKKTWVNSNSWNPHALSNFR